MGPGKDRKKVAAEGVVPGWSEAGDDATTRSKELEHRRKNGGRIGKVLEGIERDDHVDRMSRRCVSKRAPVAQSRCRGTRSSDGERVRSNVQAVDRSRGPR